MNTPGDNDPRPLLFHDWGFWGLNITQFLGAFNDNLFKQLVLLLCLDNVQSGRRDLQGLAMFLFAWPFIAFSGYAGFLSDRFSKRTIIVTCKVAEMGIVLLGFVGFATESLSLLLAVLCLMGVHSAFFGPSKYGILPELVRSTDLPRANGFILMATFLAIIFGLSAAGAVKQIFSGSLWLASLPCLLVSAIGLGTSLIIRSTPVAEPNLKFHWSCLGIAAETRQTLVTNRKMLGALLMSSIFWFVGGTVYPPSINSFGKEQLQLSDLATGIMAASTGLGIAVGCVLAGLLSKDRVRGWLVKVGAWGLTLSLGMLCIPGPGFHVIRDEIHQQKIARLQESADLKAPLFAKPHERAISNGGNVVDGKNSVQTANNPLDRGSLLGLYGSGLALVAVGLFAGLFSVPLQVFLQATAPTDQKGRIIGAFNLLNWIGIAGSAVVYSLSRFLLIDCLELPYASLFGFAALLMLPVALFYQPPETPIENS